MTDKLKKLGFKKIGRNNKIGNNIKTYNFKGTIGSNNRIDDDVILKGKIIINNNVHIARGCTISAGKEGVIFENFSTISNFVQVFGKSDDFTGNFLSEGTLEKNKGNFTKVYSKKIVFGKGSIVGSMSVILPGAYIAEFSTFGAHSVIKEITKPGYVYNNKKLVLKKKRNLKKLKKNYSKLNIFKSP